MNLGSKALSSIALLSGEKFLIINSNKSTVIQTL